MLLISKRKRIEMEGMAYEKGLEVGFRLGFQMGAVEARNRMLGEPKSLVDLQIEDILERKGE